MLRHEPTLDEQLEPVHTLISLFLDDGQLGQHRGWALRARGSPITCAVTNPDYHASLY